jgi:type I restriction enzyme M protein
MVLEVQIKGNKIFAPLKNSWLIVTPEEKVRQEYIIHLVNYYGYALEQMEQEVQVNNSKRGQGKARADIVIWKSAEDKNKRKKPVIVVECKAEHITIREEDFYQGFNYASWGGAKFFITTNLKDTKFFRVNEEAMPDVLDEIIEIPNAEELNDDKKINDFLSKTKIFTRDEFSKLLFKCHNIIRNNDKLSPEAAFDEISKILFMKIRYERKQAKKNTIFSLKQFEEDKEAYDRSASSKSIPFYQSLFEKTKDDYIDDEIFDENDTIKIRETSFMQIVKELEKYNLSDTSDDVKGIAFEEFLGKTFRGELGQFFTPRTIVNYMVEILDPQEGERICDPCCGSGGFLIKAFEYIREKIENDIQKTKDEIKKQYYTDEYDTLSEKKQLDIAKRIEELFNNLNQEFILANNRGRLRHLSYECIFGTDANPRMARTAKMNMIMHGDGHGGVHHHDGLLNVNGIFDGRFDVILTNPPFGSRVEKSLRVNELDLPTNEKARLFKSKYKNEDYEGMVLKPLQKWASERKSIIDLFDVGKMSGLTEVLFIERCLRLLKPGGRLGILLPEGVLNNSALQKVREYVEEKAKIINITSIPQDVFIASGATVKPSLVFLKKFTNEESNKWLDIEVKARDKAVLKYNPLIEKERVALDEAKKDYESKNNQLKSMNKLKGRKKVNIIVKFEEFNEVKELIFKAKNKVKEEEKLFKIKEKQLLQQMEEEIRAEIKEKFDYEIPVVEVEKAGITSTGAKCENELDDVAKEFKVYRNKNEMWKVYKKVFSYPINKEGEILRAVGVNQPEVFYE